VQNEAEENPDSQARLKIGLVGFTKIVSGALAHYLRAEHSADVTVFDDLPPTKLNMRDACDLDLVMVDSRSQTLQKIEGFRRSYSEETRPRAAIYCDKVDPSFIHAAFAHGFEGVINGDMNVDALPNVFALITCGQVFAPASILSCDLKRDSNNTARRSQLSDAQIKTLGMIAEGQTNKEIAVSLGVTEMQVKMVVRNICGALDAKNRAHAVAKAFRLGIL